uniref:Cytochrome P450 n=1 Tax=Mesocestoides corti TaxID=53468 RepID=A0A5K3G2N7_MESCO
MVGRRQTFCLHTLASLTAGCDSGLLMHINTAPTHSAISGGSSPLGNIQHIHSDASRWLCADPHGPLQKGPRNAGRCFWRESQMDDSYSHRRLPLLPSTSLVLRRDPTSTWSNWLALVGLHSMSGYVGNANH